MSRTFRPEPNHIDSLNGTEAKLTSQPVAVYYRQSTTTQVGNVSTAIQTIDMVDELARRGWNRDQITLIDDDEGVSGTKRIDEREGMSHLFELIAERKIGAVACQDEDRLFRDMTQIQVNIFIDTCRRSNVKVITPYMTYDFAHPLHGEFHARQFRFKCDMAAEYLKTYVLGRLAPARLRVLREGKWGGSKIPVGFMADMRKKLPDETENPNFRKYVPFEPYARIVREYFRIFLENNGNVRRTVQQIYRDRISFPDSTPPEGFRIRYQLKWREHGYYLNRNCVILLLTHPAYIGHWVVKGVVERWNHHEPIVDLETFMRAFNYLSKNAMNGEENPDYQPSYQYARPNLEQKRSVEMPLLPGLIYSEIDGRWYRAGNCFDKKVNCYLYTLNRVEIDGTHIEWARRAQWIDIAVVNYFKQKLQATFDGKAWAQAIQETEQAIERERRIKKLQLASLDSERQILVASLGRLTDPMFIQDAEKRYKDVSRERDRLTADLARLDAQKYTHMTSEQAYALFSQTLQDWDSMTPGEHRSMLAMFIERIVASDYSRRGDMILNLHWKDGSSDQIQIQRKPSSLNNWSMEEIKRLMEIVDSGASQLEIAGAFPKRQWQSIWVQIKRRRGIIEFSPVYLGKRTTYEEYIAKGGSRPKATSLSWRDEDLQLLKELAERGASQLEIMKTFPVRRWKYLRAKIKVLTGRLPESSDGILQKYTYLEYAQQFETPEVDGSLENRGFGCGWHFAPAPDFLGWQYQASRQS